MRNLKLSLLVVGAVSAQGLIAENAFARQTNQDPFDAMKLSVRDLGDINQDGNSEFAIGKGWQDTALADEGAVFIVSQDSTFQFSDARRITEGESGLQLDLNAGDRFGASVAPIGDLDGDGIPDLVVGVPGSDAGGWIDAGALHVLFLTSDGAVAHEQAVSSVQGSLRADLFPAAEFGRELANMGDINGDGLPELAVRMASDPGTFAGYVVSLGPDGHVIAEQEIVSTFGDIGDGSLEDLFVASLQGSGAPASMVGPSLVDTVVNLTGSDPIADFTSDVTVGTRPLTVNFSDLSTGTGINGWLWDFDDNHPSIEQNPTHPFYVIQRYDVSLTVTGQFGSDTALKPNYIDATGFTGAVRVNGSSINPDIYESITAPDFGTNWETRINGATIGGTGLTFIFSFSDWLEPTLTPFGELLVNTSGIVYANSIVAIDQTLGYAAHFIAIPADVTVFGLAIYTQGFVNNTGNGNAALTNALYVVLASPTGG